jgi:hypothetical protein
MPCQTRRIGSGKLNIAVPAQVAIDEILREERNVALLQIAPPAQLMGDVGGNVLRPVLGGVKDNHAHRAFISTGKRSRMTTSNSAASRQTRASRLRPSITR